MALPASLLEICPINPEDCKPGEFDFRQHMVDKADKEDKKSTQPKKNSRIACT